MEFKLPLACGLSLISLVCSKLEADIPLYRIEEVQLPAGCKSVGDRIIINDNGDLVLNGCGGTRFRKKGGVWQAVEYGGRGVYAYNMNSHGVITGESNWGDAVVWDPETSSSTLISVDGQRCVTRGVSDSGTVLFFCEGDAYFYEEGDITAFRDFPYSFSTEDLYPIFMSNNGMLHGWIKVGESTIHPMVISKGDLTINESVELVSAQTSNYIDGNSIGQSVVNMDFSHVSNVYGISIEGTIDVESFHAERINDHGVMVGTSPSSFNMNSDTNAAIWSEDFGLLDLNDLIATPFERKLMSARNVNNFGQIVCISLGGPYDSEMTAYVLTEIEARSVVPFRTRFDPKSVEITVPGNWEESEVGLEKSDDLKNWVHLSVDDESSSDGEFRVNFEYEEKAFLRPISYKKTE